MRQNPTPKTTERREPPPMTAATSRRFYNPARRPGARTPVQPAPTTKPTHYYEF